MRTVTKEDIGERVFVAFSGDSGLNNGYTGAGVLRFMDNGEIWDGEIHCEVEFGDKGEVSYFPLFCVFIDKE